MLLSLYITTGILLYRSILSCSTRFDVKLGCLCYSEKEELIETLANVKRQLLDMQHRESEAIDKVKAGVEITEHANLEKAQVSTSVFMFVC